MSLPPEQSSQAHSSESPSTEFRRDALRGITTAYTATHGHPLDSDTMDQSGARWSVPMRVAVYATVAVAVIGLAIGGWLLGQRHGNASSGDVTAIHAPTEPPPDQEAGESADALKVGDAGEHDVDEGEVPNETDTAGVAVSVEVAVHVAGQVQDPGIVFLPAGSRAADALDAAGGPTKEADVDAINLARVVEDGEQIYVPQPGEDVPVDATEDTAEAGGGPGTDGEGALLDLNTATSEQLQTLSGIGPAMSMRIIDWRDSNGQFTRVDQLLEIRGIGPRVFDDLKDKVTV